MTTATHRETEKNRIQPIEKITFVLNQWRHKLYIVYVYRGDAFISLLSHSKLTNRKCFCCSPYRTHFFFVSCVCDTFWNSTIDFCSVYYLYRYHVIFLFGFVLFAFFLFPFFASLFRLSCCNFSQMNHTSFSSSHFCLVERVTDTCERKWVRIMIRHIAIHLQIDAGKLAGDTLTPLTG